MLYFLLAEFVKHGFIQYGLTSRRFLPLQNQTRVTVWLYDNVNTRIEGQIVGYDEKMNLVLDQAAEVHMKSGSVKQLGRIMLKGDNVTLIQKSEDSSKK